ncbi:GNAT family N-acetyltransferase [Alkaliphilus serpentinus]|uniref:GNAT family N-acetyltransferase n=1 Tax=Alkaliphilus serpentinus TaxID=1482731 RepID=A0A833HME6_9FIRM|nr:GNAT family N-acetyltransferase [Alkaliphilus serpentinus]KAB3527600.1 GNAT family N-acetyltransferase [Alkaliphilus serpentinus]
MQIQTNRLIIRDFEVEDWLCVHRYAVKPEVIKYMDWGPNTEEETKNYIKMARDMEKQENRRDFEFAIILKKNHTLIGGCGIHQRDTNCEIGYCLDSEYWRQGYASEAATALLELGFKYLKAHRIYAFCRPENTGSEAVMKKLGMKKEGILRENIFVRGSFKDSLVYSILSHEYAR